MPAIAQHVLDDNTLFYWHLGDFRAIYMFTRQYSVLVGFRRARDY